MSGTLRNATVDFTDADLANYASRLHFNTGIDLFFNSLAILLILRHSTQAMKFYKWYILATIITSLIMDMHLTVVYGLYALFPTTIVCAAGLAKNWGWWWGQDFNYVSLLSYFKK